MGNNSISTPLRLSIHGLVDSAPTRAEAIKRLNELTKFIKEKREETKRLYHWRNVPRL